MLSSIKTLILLCTVYFTLGGDLKISHAEVINFFGKIVYPGCGKKMDTDNILLQCQNNPATPDVIAFNYTKDSGHKFKGMNIEIRSLNGSEFEKIVSMIYL